MRHTPDQRRMASRRHATWDWNRDACDVHWIDHEPYPPGIGEPGGEWDGAFLRPRDEHRREALAARAKAGRG